MSEAIVVEILIPLIGESVITGVVGLVLWFKIGNVWNHSKETRERLEMVSDDVKDHWEQWHAPKTVSAGDD